MNKYDKEALEIWVPRITIYSTLKFYSLAPYSGYTLQFKDPEAEEILLEPDVSDEILGQAVSDIIKQSRFLPLKISNALEIKVLKNYPIWIKNMMQKYEYKNKTALFKNMKNCWIENQQGILKITPLRHERLEGWDRETTDEDDYVYISKVCPQTEIGAALRLAFTRCKER